MTDQTPVPIRAYKGFQPDLTCLGFQYAEGQTFEHDGEVRACASGFHACEQPIDVLRYYPPASSVYREVELDGDISRDTSDSKVAARRLTVGASINLAGLVKAQVEYVTSRATHEEGSQATGYSGAASATGDSGAASATGYSGAASATGDSGAALANGWYGKAKVTGPDSIAIAAGGESAAAAPKGGWIVLTERDNEGHVLDVRAIKVGTKPNGKTGLTVKADTYYRLAGGQVVAA